MTLKQLFTDIANAIRAKTGSAEPIKAIDLPNAINGIETGGKEPMGVAGVYYTMVNENDYPIEAYAYGSIMPGLFSGNDDIERIFVSPDITKIPSSFIRSTTHVELVEMSALVDSIGAYAFNTPSTGAVPIILRLSDGRENVVPELVTVIENYAFSTIKTSTPMQLHDGIVRINDYGLNNASIALSKLPAALTYVGSNGFAYCANNTFQEIPAGIQTIAGYAFRSNTGLTKLTFKGTPTSIASTAFSGCTGITEINVPWAEGAVANAPWGATKATINYDCEV